ncbi:MAG TPA: phosphoenolpyruvate--protein phosphotransferase [Clostridia bacterium]|nr:phosphoenolpyruvate--protein phosphotransferase [Clostridia bacterium]
MKLAGISASAGIAIAPAYIIEAVEFAITQDKIEDPVSEIQEFRKALELSKKELEIIRDKTKLAVDEDNAAIFDAHIEILKDPELLSQTEDIVSRERANAASTFSKVAESYAIIFESMDDCYFKERAADIRDVSRRVTAHLLGVKTNSLELIDKEVIIIAEDLTPSDTAQLDKAYVKGFITKTGGRTSHSAIMARTLGIPAVVGADTILSHCKNGDLIILDGITGEVIVNPSQEIIEAFTKRQKQYEAERIEWARFKSEPSTTQDGHRIELAGNIGSPDDLQGVIDNGGEGIGLYRTEFLYMNNKRLPTEEEQFQAYKAVLEGLDGKAVIIRTLDIGGDKKLPYMEMPPELNPFLGFRAVRLCLEKTDLFRTQLRSLLRASMYGKLKIMFPMIATLSEFRKAKGLLQECKKELVSEGIGVSDDIEVGIMVEIPAAVVLADQFAKEVDFFSIGTNDLIQYTFAADRMNEKVSYLYQPYNPSLLRLIKMVTDASHKEGKWTGICGEMAGDEIAIPLLIGLGIDELSMSASSILPARQLISRLKYEETVKLCDQALMQDSDEAVYELVKKAEENAR